MEAWKKEMQLFWKSSENPFSEAWTAIITITHIYEKLNHKSYLCICFSKLLYVYDKSGFQNMNRLKITKVWLTVFFISKMQGQNLHLLGPLQMVDKSKLKKYRTKTKSDNINIKYEDICSQIQLHSCSFLYSVAQRVCFLPRHIFQYLSLACIKQPNVDA